MPTAAIATEHRHCMRTLAGIYATSYHLESDMGVGMRSHLLRAIVNLGAVRLGTQAEREKKTEAEMA